MFLISVCERCADRLATAYRTTPIDGSEREGSCVLCGREGRIVQYECTAERPRPFRRRSGGGERRRAGGG